MYYHIAGRGRRAFESLPRALGQRGPRTDPGDPSRATRVADARRAAAQAEAGRGAQAASQRATAAATGAGRERSGRGTELPGQHDADEARPHEVPYAHPRHRVPAPMAARGEDGYR